MESAAYIDGHFVKGGGTSFGVENPSDESLIAEVTGASFAQVDAAIASARRAFDDGRWSGLPARERAAVMRRYGEALRKR